jgi:hypothetical protein
VKLADFPWWSRGSQCELELMVAELVDGVEEHRPRCADCRAHDAREPGSLPCKKIGNAIDVVLRWRERRILLDRARYYGLQAELEHVQRQLRELDAEVYA